MFAILSVVAAGSVAAAALHVADAREAHAERMAASGETRALLEGRLEAAESFGALGEGAYDRTSMDIRAMEHAGVAVAEAQNRYLYVDADSLGDGALAEAYAAIRSDMEEYVDGDDLPVQWYYPGSSVGERVSWRFEGAYEIPGEGADAVWSCFYEGDGTDGDVLLAYAVGDFDTATGRFTDLSRRVTSEGAELSSATVDVRDAYGADGDTEPIGGDEHGK